MAYDFKQLSARDFEELVRDLLQAEWSVTLEGFAPGPDKGIDLRHAPDPSRITVIQCKHYACSGFAKLLSHLRRVELPKATRLRPWRYVITTSVGLTPANKQAIEGVFSSFIHGPQDVLGREDLNDLLARHPDVERKHFKLWLASTSVLERVLHNAELCQTVSEIERIHSRLSLYVDNSCYLRAMEMLQRTRIVIIAGPPGVGKTTLAELLLYSHLEQGYKPVVIRSSVKEGCKLFSPALKQVFYFDDFLGQSFLGEQRDFLARNQDAAILSFMDMVARSPSARMIMTTRAHILQRACQWSERFDQSLIRTHKCVLEMEDYSVEQRARMLYNHVYFSDLPHRYRRQFTNATLHLKVLRHNYFNPRVVEWIASYARVKHIEAHRYGSFVEEVLDSPERVWRHSFERQVSEASRSVVLALRTLETPADLQLLLEASESLHMHRVKKYNLASAPGEVRAAFNELDGAFIRMDPDGVNFLNPSVAEFTRRLMCEGNDHLADVIASICHFQQLKPMSELIAHHDHQGYVDKHAQQLTDTFIRVTRALPSVEQSGHETWSTLLSAFGNIARRVGLTSLREHGAFLVEKVIEHSDYITCLTDAYSSLDCIPWDVAPLRHSLKEAVFRRLRVGDAQDFIDATEAVEELWTSVEKRRFQVEFGRYILERMESEMAERSIDAALEIGISLRFECWRPGQLAQRRMERFFEGLEERQIAAEAAEWARLGVDAEVLDQGEPPGKVIDLMEALRASLALSSAEEADIGRLFRLL